MIDMARLKRLGYAITALALWSTASQASTQPIERFRLSNGLEVVVLPNHRVPAVNHMLWFRIGAADDPEGKSGLAHFHEHLMFKGSPKFKSGEYTQLLDQNGGEHNAFTGRDTTSYYVTIAKEKLPLVMQLEADRMKALTVSDEEAKLENKVILEERNQRIENSPEAMLSEQMQAALFRNHPYHLPVIGWRHEMEGLTKQDVITFHETYYHPNNALLIVSGDITAAELRPLAEKYYGALPQKTIPPRIWKSEPPQIAPRHIDYEHQHVKQPLFKRFYATDSFPQAGTYKAMTALVMSHMLGGGKNSYLYRKLVVEQKLATSVDADYNLFARGPATFSIEITPEAGVSLETVEKSLDNLLRAFTDEVDDASLTRSKNMMKADAIYAREGLTSISNVMGWLMMVGQSPELFNKWPDLIEQVKLDDIKKTFTDIAVIEHSVTGYLLPKRSAQ